MGEKRRLVGDPDDDEASNPAPDARFEGVLQDYRRFLRATIARLCPRDAGLDIDDIEQEARIRLWRALQSEREIESLASYIYKVAVTTTIDALRRVKARREQRLQDEVQEGNDQGLPPPGAPSPEEAAHRQLLLENVRRILGSLGDDRRRAVELYLQGYTTEETGRLLGWSEAKARNLTYRSLAELRERLRAEGIAYED